MNSSQRNNPSRVKKADWSDKKRTCVGIEDMTMLSKVSNEQINENLKIRFESSLIYTYIGHVLISVNPYRDLGIYSSQIAASYHGKSRIESPPHIFSIAEEAYHNMLAYKQHQCVIISGESGAGKTESAKRIMEYITEIACESRSGDSSRASHVKDMILATNPLLESFGNAKTLRNNNSSRFGKYLEMEFEAGLGIPEGGKITNYLLEKSRVVSQIEGERNFHIFYQVCSNSPHFPAQWKQQFALYSAQDYLYLSTAGCLQIEGIDDLQDFEATLDAMKMIGITLEEQFDIFQLISAILWIGNITFEPLPENEETSRVCEIQTAQHVGHLLGVDSDALMRVLTSKMVETSRGGKRGSAYEVPLNPSQAKSVQDALAKAIYHRLFEWIVCRTNQSIRIGEKSGTDPFVIGILDIYGFEIFNVNGFEQLCINYVNEKLQQIFIELTLFAEQQEYIQEGISWSQIAFFDNKIVCDLLEAKSPPGIFSLIDDACATAHADPCAADRSLLQRLGGLSSHPQFKFGGKGFTISHYAGDVSYDGAGMTDRNKDVLVVDVLQVLQRSTNHFLLHLFPDAAADRSAVKKPTTAGFKIKTSCNELVRALKECAPHYVRCIKPNDVKSSSIFDSKRVLHQVRYLGLLENIRVRRAGFCYRQIFDKFLDRFFLLSRRTSYAGEYIWEKDSQQGCQCILQDCGVSSEEWQIGNSKVFLRHPETLWALEHLRERYWHNMAMKIQRAWRFVVRYRHECALRIQKAWLKYSSMLEFYQKRDYGHQVLAQRKQRRRFSLLSYRKFHGDYLNLRQNPLLQTACLEAITEKPVFSSFCDILTHRFLHASKFQLAALLITDQKLYLMSVSETTAPPQKAPSISRMDLQKKIPLASISSFSLSDLQDDILVIHLSSGSHDSKEADLVLNCAFKTEIITQILWAIGKSIPVQISPQSIEYRRKGGKLAKLSFECSPHLQTPAMIFKKSKISIAAGMSSTSASLPPCAKPLRAKKPITKGRLLSKKPDPRPRKPAQDFEKKAPPSPVSPPSSASFHCSALYAYEAQLGSELSFPKDALLLIVETLADGWWLAEYEGQRGFVPHNYVERVKTAPFSAKSLSPSTLRQKPAIPAKPLLVSPAKSSANSSPSHPSPSKPTLSPKPPIVSPKPQIRKKPILSPPSASSSSAAAFHRSPPPLPTNTSSSNTFN